MPMNQSSRSAIGLNLRPTLGRHSSVSKRFGASECAHLSELVSRRGVAQIASHGVSAMLLAGHRARVYRFLDGSRVDGIRSKRKAEVVPERMASLRESHLAVNAFSGERLGAHGLTNTQTLPKMTNN